MRSEKGRPGDPPVVTLFGSYAPRSDSPLYELAYAIGWALAEAGFVVCNGGYDGTMEASAKGAKDAGGTTIGVTCPVFTGARGKPLTANRFIDREIAHDDVLARIEAMMRMSAAYVVLEGGTGTLSEFAIVWEYVAKKLIDPRPIVVVGDFWEPLVERVVAARAKSGKHVHRAASADDVLAVLERTIGLPDG